MFNLVIMNNKSKKKIILIFVVVFCMCCCLSSIISGGTLFLKSDKKDEPTASPPAASPTAASPPAASPPAASKQYAILPYETAPKFNEEGKVWALAGLDVTCRQSKKNPLALSQFHLKSGSVGFGKNNIKYDYKCLAGVEKEHTISGFDSEGKKQTKCDVHGGGNTVYLDRHTVDCGKSPIIQFKGNRCMSTDKYRYDYRCGKHISESCRDVTTEYNDQGAGNVVYLDRHDVKCKEGEEYISKFRLDADDNDTTGRYRYEYKCCKP